ncbi:MAG: CpXC domain-containing protein [Anaerolineae bacterium]
MSQPQYQTVPVTCPNCQNRFVTPVLTIIDTGQNPEAKNLFLSGQVNVAICPQCGQGGMLSTPIVYHDPEKELFFTFVPTELGLADQDQQRVVGDLTNQVISSLPPEQRKGYLLRPKSFLRLEAMIEAILEADGITPEMLEAQRAKSALLDRLLRASDDETRRLIAQENDAQIDYEFFQLLTLNLELAQTQGQTEAARQLSALRQGLLEWTTEGKEVASREAAIRELGAEITREGLLEKLIAAARAGEQAKVETMVAVARPAIDYMFYQQLATQIEAAEQAENMDEAATLRELRENVLDLTAQIDAEMEQATEDAAQLLQKIVDSENLEQAVLEHLGQIDDLFMSVLSAQIRAAEQAEDSQSVEKLQEVGNIVLTLIQESQPPELRMINDLMNADYPEGTQALLEELRDLVTPEFVELLSLVGQQLKQTNREQAAERLAQIQEQAAAMVA